MKKIKVVEEELEIESAEFTDDVKYYQVYTNKYVDLFVTVSTSPETAATGKLIFDIDSDDAVSKADKKVLIDYVKDQMGY